MKTYRLVYVVQEVPIGGAPREVKRFESQVEATAYLTALQAQADAANAKTGDKIARDFYLDREDP